MSRNDFLSNDLYPAIYSEYRSLLDGIYSVRRLYTETQKQCYLQDRQDSARKLWSEYQTQHISPDYSKHDYQEVYLMRYLFPYSLIVPTLLHHLKNLCHFKNELFASFFGCGPGSEIHGLMHYLNKTQSGIIKISPAMLDITSTGGKRYLYPSYSDEYDKLAGFQPGWKHSKDIVFNHLLSKIQNSTLYRISDFNSDLAGEETGFLRTTSEACVKRSDLICLQFCINEIPILRHKQLITNLMYIVDIMKPGALMLIIERNGYDPVTNLLTDLHSGLSEFDNVRTFYEQDSRLDLTAINNYVPKELKTYLFLTKSSSKCWEQNNPRCSDTGLWLANKIEFKWLAVSKQ